MSASATQGGHNKHHIASSTKLEYVFDAFKKVEDHVFLGDRL